MIFINIFVYEDRDITGAKGKTAMCPALDAAGGKGGRQGQVRIAVKRAPRARPQSGQPLMR